MGLRERLDEDMKAALRSQETLRLSTIRMVKAAMKNKEVEPGAKGPLDDAGIEKVIASEIKKRRDAVAEYEKATRQDLADKEKAEIVVLQGYLPEQLAEAEVDRLVDEAISETGAQGPKDMGAVMKAVGAKVQGRAEGRVVSEKVKAKLSSLS